MAIDMVFVSKYLVPKGFRGITLFPFIFLREAKDKSNTILIHHERIHLRQQLELLIFPFYLVYFLEWFVKLCYYRDRRKAYLNLSFEREAYQNESNLDYLKKRKWFQFLQYM
jgi:hypothetical protein